EGLAQLAPVAGELLDDVVESGLVVRLHPLPDSLRRLVAGQVQSLEPVLDLNPLRHQTLNRRQGLSRALRHHSSVPGTGQPGYGPICRRAKRSASRRSTAARSSSTTLPRSRAVSRILAACSRLSIRMRASDSVAPMVTAPWLASRSASYPVRNGSSC